MSTFSRHIEFSDTEDIRRAVRTYGWDVSYTRTGPGDLGVAAWETQVGDLLLYREHFEFPMLAYGVSPSEGFSVLTVQNGGPRVYGNELSSQTIALFPAGAQFDIVSQSDLELFHVQVSGKRLAAEAQKVGVELATSDHALLVTPGPDRIRHLGRLMEQANSILAAGDQAAWRETEDDLLALLLAVFDRNEVETHRMHGSTGPTSEYAIQARRYVHSRLPGELDLPGLTEALGITRRHLNRCFKDHYGMSLQDFIHCRRLHEARHLLQQHPDGLNVTQTAYTCGFNHLGRFSTQYKQLFGESPRQTLHAANA
jgi:AraC family ethanolamine operon transcriptional activator